MLFCLTLTNPLLNATEQLGRNDPGPGAERPHLGRTWGGSTRGGTTLGRIDRYPHFRYVLEMVDIVSFAYSLVFVSSDANIR